MTDEVFVGAEVSVDLRKWLDDYRWTHRKTIKEVVTDALEEYRQRRTQPVRDLDDVAHDWAVTEAGRREAQQS